ncbi:hypothetical protein BS17DRAFT_780355 [Gyrodon lividus]|nr:hypothetical protein BS17DRAFT_780355 [Gyrodon lividus]
MPIAPITGKLRKRLWLDLSVALGLGVTSAYAFWYGSHLKAGISVYVNRTTTYTFVQCNVKRNST